MIDWAKAQAALARAGCSPGAVDGDRGMKTLRALLDFTAGRTLGGPGDERAAGALAWYDAYGMTTPARLAEFLAQTSHETGGFRANVEDLTYTTAASIRRTWPSRFPTEASAQPYVRNPQALANKVYARPEEGNTRPGDGWAYRGRGDLQLTFRNGYAAMGATIGVDLVSNPDRAAEPGLSHRIALEFWRRNAVNACCDAGDFFGARGLTNCGSRTPKVAPIGLADVAARRARLLTILKGDHV